MSEMVERVAKTLIKRGGIDGGADFLARIAIEAMREPTRNMLFVGSNEEAGFTTGNLRESWYLMIDEALR